jgi:hypothetical protein
VVVAPLELEFIITDSKFEAAKFVRDLVADDIMCCMESVASMLFAIEIMIAEQSAWLTTRTLEGAAALVHMGSPSRRDW